MLHMSDQCWNNSWEVQRNRLLPRQTIKIETFFHWWLAFKQHNTKPTKKLKQTSDKFCGLPVAKKSAHTRPPTATIIEFSPVVGVGCGAVRQACALQDSLTAPTATLHFNIKALL